MKNSHHLLKLTISIASSLIVVPIILYFHQFAHFGLSDSQSIWGAFGDFMNVWVSMASLLILGTLTFSLDSLNFNRQKAAADLEDARLKANRETEDARNRPFIIYKYDVTHSVWKIKNVGIGPALNIRLSFRDKEGAWRMPTKIHSLSGGEEMPFPYESPDIDAVLCFVYNDVRGIIISTFGQYEDSLIKVDEDLLSEFDVADFTSQDALTKAQKIIGFI